MARGHGMRVWLALLTVYLVWGSTFVALAVVVRDMPPLLAMAVRHLVAGSLLLALARPWRAGGERIGARQLRAGLVFGGLLFVAGHGGLAWAQQTVPAGVAALLVGTIPLWMAALDRVLLGRRLSPAASLGFLLGFAGLAVLVDPLGEGAVDRAGAAVILLGALAWAAGSLYSRGAPLPRHPLASAGLGSLCGGALLAAGSALSGELPEARVTASSALALGYLVVMGSLVGFSAYVWLLRSAPTSLVATYAYANPVVAVALGWLLLGEEVTLRTALAGGAVIGSVALILRASGTAREPGRGLLRRRLSPAPTR